MRISDKVVIRFGSAIWDKIPAKDPINNFLVNFRLSFIYAKFFEIWSLLRSENSFIRKPSPYSKLSLNENMLENDSIYCF